MQKLETLMNQEIDVCLNNEVIKVIKRNIRRNDVYRPNIGTVEVQKRKWVKVFFVNYASGPRWRLHVEDNNKSLDLEYTIKK